MKRTIFILFLPILLCQEQNNTGDTINNSTTTLITKKMKIVRPELTDSFEILDINKYKELGTVKNEISYDDDNKEIKYISLDYTNHENGIELVLFGNNLSGYVSYEIADDSYIQTAKGYYPNGKIKIKYLRFNNTACNLHIGREYRYDKDGCLNYAIAADAEYDFTFEQLLEYLLEKEQLPLKPGYIRVGSYRININLIKENNKPLWKIVWFVLGSGFPGKEITLKLDGKTGEAVERIERDAPIREE